MDIVSNLLDSCSRMQSKMYKTLEASEYHFSQTGVTVLDTGICESVKNILEIKTVENGKVDELYVTKF